VDADTGAGEFLEFVSLGDLGYTRLRAFASKLNHYHLTGILGIQGVRLLAYRLALTIMSHLPTGGVPPILPESSALKHTQERLSLEIIRAVGSTLEDCLAGLSVISNRVSQAVENAVDRLDQLYTSFGGHWESPGRIQLRNWLYDAFHNHTAGLRLFTPGAVKAVAGTVGTKLAQYSLAHLTPRHDTTLDVELLGAIVTKHITESMRGLPVSDRGIAAAAEAIGRSVADTIGVHTRIHPLTAENIRDCARTAILENLPLETYCSDDAVNSLSSGVVGRLRTLLLI
jgi:hypothetical protein